MLDREIGEDQELRVVSANWTFRVRQEHLSDIYKALGIYIKEAERKPGPIYSGSTTTPDMEF